jgi:hypothetical protein
MAVIPEAVKRPLWLSQECRIVLCVMRNDIIYTLPNVWEQVNVSHAYFFVSDLNHIRMITESTVCLIKSIVCLLRVLHDRHSERQWSPATQWLATSWTVRGSNFGGGRDFPHPYRPALGPTQLPIQWVLGLFPGGKAAGAWSWPPTPI